MSQEVKKIIELLKENYSDRSESVKMEDYNENKILYVKIGDNKGILSD
ncbi:MAG: hypothetical protein Q8S15_01610 [Erysipelotrichaceae bacterium]|nr:hypothetical protein [Erysipelotrichaceae bacterium]